MFLINAIIEIAVFYFFAFRKYRSDYKIEKARYKKVLGARTSLDDYTTKLPILTETTGDQIYIGDIMKLKYNEICPCDMLVLATCEFKDGEQVCKVNSLYEDGKTARQIKRGVSLTKSFGNSAFSSKTVSNFLSRLNAKVDYEKCSTLQIKGSFKLKTDPITENFSGQNVIFKGTILKSKQIIGLVLYNGKLCLDTDTYSTVLLTKVSEIEEKMKVFTLLTIILNCIACILTALTFNRISIYTGTKVHKLMDQVGIFTYISLYFSVLPLGVNTMLNLFFCISVFILQKTYRIKSGSLHKQASNIRVDSRKSTTGGLSRSSTMSYSNQRTTSEEQSSFRILNPNVIPNLGDIDDIFFDKTNTLSSSIYQLDTIAVNGKCYISEEKDFGEAVEEDIQGIKPGDEYISSPIKLQLNTNLPTKTVEMNLLNKQTSKPAPKVSKQLGRHDGDSVPNSISNRLDSEEAEVLSPRSIPKSMKSIFNKSYAGGNFPKADEYDFSYDFTTSESICRLIRIFGVCHNAKPNSS